MMLHARNSVLLLLALFLLLPAYSGLTQAAQPVVLPLAHLDGAVFERNARTPDGGPFEEIGRWIQQTWQEVKSTVGRWSKVDIGEGISKAIQDAMDSVGNLGRGISHEMEKSVPK